MLARLRCQPLHGKLQLTIARDDSKSWSTRPSRSDGCPELSTTAFSHHQAIRLSEDERTRFGSGKSLKPPFMSASHRCPTRKQMLRGTKSILKFAIYRNAIDRVFRGIVDLYPTRALDFTVAASIPVNWIRFSVCCSKGHSCPIPCSALFMKYLRLRYETGYIPCIILANMNPPRSTHAQSDEGCICPGRLNTFHL